MTGKNVMNAEDVVVNDPFDHIEQPPPPKHCAKQNPSIPRRTPVTARAKQHRQSGQRHQPERQMKESILRILKLKLLYGRGPAMRRQTDEMMPAQNLVEDDSVGEASKPQAEDEARPNERIRHRFHLRREP